MVVTVFYPSTIYGGPTTVALNQALELVNKGYEVTVITSDINAFDKQKKNLVNTRVLDNIKVLYFPSKYILPKFSLIYSYNMVKWLKNNAKNYDIAHIHFGREIFPYLAAKTCMDLGVPYVLQTHGMLNKKNGIRTLLDTTLIKKIIKNAKTVLALQEIEEQLIIGMVPSSNVKLLPNGIKINDNKKWDSEKLNKKKILFLARLHPRKRVLDFIEMAKITNRFDSSIQYRIVGPDGGELLIAKNKVSEYNLDNVIEFVGNIKQEKVIDEFVNASLYVLPSIDEPFAMSVLEALSLGVPTIGTDGLHNKKLLSNYNAIEIVERKPEDLATSVLNILNNVDKAENLSLNGRNLIHKELNIEKVIQKLESIYSE
nr:glycosyltransferase [Fictibacillus marinisediminis]